MLILCASFFSIKNFIGKSLILLALATKFFVSLKQSMKERGKRMGLRVVPKNEVLRDGRRRKQDD